MASATIKLKKDNKASLKTVKKWEKEFNCLFEYELTGNDVTRLRCKTCKRWESRINKSKGFQLTWIRPGTQSIKKDGVKVHCNSAQHKEASRLEERSRMGALPYLERVVKESPIGRGVRKMCDKDRESLRVKFNWAYHVAKNELPFNEYPDLLKTYSKITYGKIDSIGKGYATDRAGALFIDVVGDYMKAGLTEELKHVRFFSVLSDGSTDSANIEEELVYFLYLAGGVPKVTFLSIEDAKNVDANGLLECITTAFSRFNIDEISKHILGLNVDGASVNTGIHGGLGVLIKEQAPWLQVIHCFNHRLELAIKDAFKNTAFAKIDEMLSELYKLYQYSSKRLRELKRFAEAWDETVPKPTKSTGT